MTPELEVELRTTVASLRVKTSCQELLIMALLELPDDQHVAVARVGEGCQQASPIGLGAGCAVLEHLRASRRVERIVATPDLDRGC